MQHRTTQCLLTRSQSCNNSRHTQTHRETQQSPLDIGQLISDRKTDYIHIYLTCTQPDLSNWPGLQTASVQNGSGHAKYQWARPGWANLIRNYTRTSNFSDYPLRPKSTLLLNKWPFSHSYIISVHFISFEEMEMKIQLIWRQQNWTEKQTQTKRARPESKWTGDGRIIPACVQVWSRLLSTSATRPVKQRLVMSITQHQAEHFPHTVSQ